MSRAMRMSRQPPIPGDMVVIEPPRGSEYVGTCVEILFRKTQAGHHRLCLMVDNTDPLSPMTGKRVVPFRRVLQWWTPEAGEQD